MQTTIKIVHIHRDSNTVLCEKPVPQAIKTLLRYHKRQETVELYRIIFDNATYYLSVCQWEFGLNECCVNLYQTTVDETKLLVSIAGGQLCVSIMPAAQSADVMEIVSLLLKG